MSCCWNYLPAGCYECTGGGGGMAVVIFRRVASLMISGGECGAVCENDWFGRYSSEKTVDVELSQENASQDVQC